MWDRGPGNSDQIIRELADKYTFVKPVWLSRNFGQHAATIAGMSSSGGEWIVTMDEDGQQDPRFIPQLWTVHTVSAPNWFTELRATLHRIHVFAILHQRSPKSFLLNHLPMVVSRVQQLPTVAGRNRTQCCCLHRCRCLFRCCIELGRGRLHRVPGGCPKRRARCRELQLPETGQPFRSLDCLQRHQTFVLCISSWLHIFRGRIHCDFVDHFPTCSWGVHCCWVGLNIHSPHVDRWLSSLGPWNHCSVRGGSNQHESRKTSLCCGA